MKKQTLKRITHTMQNHKFVRLSSGISRAGLIPYTVNDDKTVDVCVMIPSDPRFGGTRPQLAKGRIENGMNALETAIKEAKEELGYVYTPGKDIIELLVDNFYGIRIYCVKVDSKSLDLKPDFETQYVAWLKLPNDFDKIRKFQLPVFKTLYNKAIT